MKTRLYIVEMFQKRKEKTTPFGTSITRSEVLYWASQGLRGVNVVFALPMPPISSGTLYCTDDEQHRPNIPNSVPDI